MEPRARAGKNVGKMNFTHTELAQLLYGHGDVKAPLPETVRVLDEIATDFIQGVAFEATRAAHHAGRQKVKFEDFEFAMRRNPRYMGKIQEVFEKKREIENARKNFSIEDQIVRDEKNAEKVAEKLAEKAERRQSKKRNAEDMLTKGEEREDVVRRESREGLEGGVEGRGDNELLDEADDDPDAEADIGTASQQGAKRSRMG
ncbi:transcription initiation factor IID [Apodospora peruviana]|uniref:Transcription initiation factor TFIID subunit 13 n=1 Tax=Apodospora peruviana TaxID=516989 RepID=A0AAE0M1L9_9PEZI|nr:transcription initiation factor IID [Apodospora peruviana]